MSSEERNKQFGLPLKKGTSWTAEKNWLAIQSFIKSNVWNLDDPPLESDKEDPLLKDKIPFGMFMMGFDFHVTKHSSPKLIEVNTNAGGLASAIALETCGPERDFMKDSFAKALVHEFQDGLCYFSKDEQAREFWEKRVGSQVNPKPQTVAIVDTNAPKQGLYPEMVQFTEILATLGIDAFVVSPEDLELKEGDGLYFNDKAVDFVYNRLTDFRLESKEHQHLRKAAVEKQIVLSPHPAAYVRTADKRNLVRLSQVVHPTEHKQEEEQQQGGEDVKKGEIQELIAEVVPKAWIMTEKDITEWQKLRKKLVFKPVDGFASKGVYKGDKISASKLKSLDPPAFIAQELCPPGFDEEDGTKWDLRVFYRSSVELLGMASRHFSGQVMEMSGAKSGFRRALPEGICCMMAQRLSAAACEAACCPEGVRENLKLESGSVL